jgi:hypothetical protein
MSPDFKVKSAAVKCEGPADRAVVVAVKDYQRGQGCEVMWAAVVFADTLTFSTDGSLLVYAPSSFLELAL